MKAQHRYGAELTRPSSQVERESSPLMPNCFEKKSWAPLTTVSSGGAVDHQHLSSRCHGPGTAGAPLTHPLYGGTGRAQHDDQVQQLGLGPSVLELISHDVLVAIAQASVGVVPEGILGAYGAVTKGLDVGLVTELIISSVRGTHLLELGMTVAGQGVGQLGVDLLPDLDGCGASTIVDGAHDVLMADALGLGSGRRVVSGDLPLGRVRHGEAVVEGGARRWTWRWIWMWRSMVMQRMSKMTSPDGGPTDGVDTAPMEEGRDGDGDTSKKKVGWNVGKRVR